eukprot:TRINITY_DN2507_c1_g3_i1.p1 TRINITY_DN2507_c1_g3~~TRINITY_DN2507_c1_g3_i1.p1  ORF type:complete len:1033 (+),score=401.69 TRINITY_DN2507_c1_g3_i1:49-3147(+)
MPLQSSPKGPGSPATPGVGMRSRRQSRFVSGEDGGSRRLSRPGSPADEEPGSPQRSPGGTALSPQRLASRRKSRRASATLLDLTDDAEGDVAEQNVKVMLRVRPFNAREQKIHAEKSDSYLRSIIEMPDGMAAGRVQWLEKLQSGEDEYAVAEEFNFDKCFWSIPHDMHPYKFDFCSQETVYSESGKLALRNAWRGFNTCIFAYGQTGSGKTHTMMGPFTFADDMLEGQPGVIPQLCRELYQSIESKTLEQEREPMKMIKVKYETELCAFEIYNERVRDLFFAHTPGREPNEELKVRKHPIEGPFVYGISKLVPRTWQECLTMIEEGNAKRTVAATAMNADSSRSHSVFQIRFTQIETSIPQDKFEKPVTNRKFSSINLIDLAGSERNKKSKAEGERLVEAANINLSLSTLKRVIDALVHNSTHPKQQKQVPYRESVLTLLLMNSLGGNSRTMMLACVSPHYDNADETLSTLRYASAARKIVNVVKRNEDSKARQNLLLKQQLEELQNQLEDRQAGDVAPEEIEELMDEIRIGQEEMAMAQQEMQKMEEEASRLQKEKEEEQEKRYHAAFQHSFQMVILRRQKEEALRQASELKAVAEEHKANADQLHVAHSQLAELRAQTEVHKEQVQKYSQELESAIATRRAAEDSLEKKRQADLEQEYGVAWAQSYRRKKERQKNETQLNALKREYDEMIEESARLYSDLCAKYTDDVDELNRKLRSEQVRAEKLESALATREAQLEKLRGEHASSHEILRSRHAEDMRKKETEHAEFRNMSALSEERMSRALEAQKQYGERVEAELRRGFDDRISQAEEAAAARAARAEADAHGRIQRAEETHSHKLRVVEGTHEAAMQQLRDEHRAAVGEREAQLLAKVEEQASILADMTRREQRYRDLARQLDEALIKTPSDASPDLVEWLARARTFRKELTSNPINRAAVERARLPPDAQGTSTLPAMTYGDGDMLLPLSPSRALRSPLSNGRHGTPRGTPSPRRGRPRSPRAGRVSSSTTPSLRAARRAPREAVPPSAGRPVTV